MRTKMSTIEREITLLENEMKCQELKMYSELIRQVEGGDRGRESEGKGKTSHYHCNSQVFCDKQCLFYTDVNLFITNKLR